MIRWHPTSGAVPLPVPPWRDSRTSRFAQALIALLCLIPAGGRIQLARHAALLAFCVTTYALAPVAGFGWLIATMGLVHCRANQLRLRGAYIAVFVLILLYSEIPWTGVLTDRTGR